MFGKSGRDQRAVVVRRRVGARRGLDGFDGLDRGNLDGPDSTAPSTSTDDVVDGATGNRHVRADERRRRRHGALGRRLDSRVAEAAGARVVVGGIVVGGTVVGATVVGATVVGGTVVVGAAVVGGTVVVGHGCSVSETQPVVWPSPAHGDTFVGCASCASAPEWAIASVAATAATATTRIATMRPDLVPCTRSRPCRWSRTIYRATMSWDNEIRAVFRACHGAGA